MCVCVTMYHLNVGELLSQYRWVITHRQNINLCGGVDQSFHRHGVDLCQHMLILVQYAQLLYQSRLQLTNQLPQLLR